MNRQKIYYNSTFNMGSNIYLNACVGNNGIQDHATYGLGYDQATRHLINAAKTKIAPSIDAIIHPIVFCARHRIELFLKDNLYKFNIIRKNNEVIEKILCSTHDLHTLWNKFKKVGNKTDKRLNDFITKVEEYVLDFAEIDPTGETFRYPYDKYKTQHLKETPIINIEIFERRYIQLSEWMNDFEYLTDFLIEEYQQKTYTDELSREDIREISAALPSIDGWTKSSFNDIKREIREKYKLSNTKLSCVINMIKSHREFCINIGLERPLDELPPSCLTAYINIYNSFQSKRFSNTPNNALPKYINNKTFLKYVNKLNLLLSKESIICIYTLIELGKLYDYGEAYENFYFEKKEIAKDEFFFSEYLSAILYNAKALVFIKKALKMTGQKTLITVFDQALDRRPIITRAQTQLPRGRKRRRVT